MVSSLEETNTSGAFATPEPDAKAMRSERGSVTTVPVATGSVPLACAVARKISNRNREDHESVSSSMSSVTSSTMLDRQQLLIRKREVARAKREAAEARHEEMQLEEAIAEMSSRRSTSRRNSSVGSPRRTNSVGSPEANRNEGFDLSEELDATRGQQRGSSHSNGHHE